MAKKKQRNRPATQKPAQKGAGGEIGRYYRHNKAKIIRYANLTIGAAVVLALLILGALWLNKKNKIASAAVYFKAARREFLLNHYDQAQIEYHKALNEDPTIPSVHLEAAFSQARLNAANGKSFQIAVAAGKQVIDNDPKSVVGNAGVAQLLVSSGDLVSIYAYAHAGLKAASAADDSAGIISSCLSLVSYFRTKEIFDSAAVYGERAVALAEKINDDQILVSSQAGTGFAELQINQLKRGEELFRAMMSNPALKDTFYLDIAMAGMSDYFLRVKQIDSAYTYSSAVKARNKNIRGSESATYATQLLGKALREKGDYAAGATALKESLEAWHVFGSLADLIDNLNDLGILYQSAKDYYNARIYYLAAGKIAEKNNYARKNLYDADMNVRILHNLKPAEYQRAGREADSLIQLYEFKVGS